MRPQVETHIERRTQPPHRTWTAEVLVGGRAYTGRGLSGYQALEDLADQLSETLADYLDWLQPPTTGG